ncbi:MAG: hypothetical protein HF982_06600 [Desulfobacteraceae bacterium]|nr:hypothetical protein [Desulfobacteraceae bacterium]MBC2719243.1 hypothetical protein [Desulfobacteraceae bacterium]
MSEKAEIIKLKPSDVEHVEKIRMQLDSGRQVMVHSSEKDELIEIAETDGEIIMKVRMTDNGPVISVCGAHLELKSTETIALEAKKIKIKAKEKVVVESNGGLEIDSSKKMAIHSNNDICVAGKIIHLN